MEKVTNTCKKAVTQPILSFKSFTSSQRMAKISPELLKLSKI